MNQVLLPNDGRVDSITPNLYYPRLQVNKRGEIILATGKEGSLTTGILVGKTPECVSALSLGKKFDDWEVVGELTDYDGEVQVSLSNRVKKVLSPAP
jgi:hypothetical protein